MTSSASFLQKRSDSQKRFDGQKRSDGAGRADAARRDIRRAAESAAAAFPALMIEAERVAQTVAAGLHGRRRAGPGETFWQHRPYSFGDSVAAIDWRQSARSPDRLYVRQNEWEAAAAVWIWRDPSRSFDFASTEGAPTKRRRGDVLAVALSILLAQAGERVGVVGARARPFIGRGAPAMVLEALTAPDRDDASTPPAVAAGPGARTVWFGDFYAAPEAVAAAIAASAGAGAGGTLVQVVDPSEEDFAFEGRVEFSDPESAARVVFGDAASLRAAYRARFAGYRAALADACRRHGWSFISHRTDVPAHACLLALHAATGRLRRGG